MECVNVVRFSEGMRRGGLKPSQTYARIRAGLWPQPVKLGARASGFVEAEVDSVLKAMVAGWTTEQLRDLVARLHADRAKFAEGLPGAPAPAAGTR